MAAAFRASGNCWAAWPGCGAEPTLPFPQGVLASASGWALLPQAGAAGRGEGGFAGLVALQGFNPLTPLRQHSASRNSGPTSGPELEPARALEPFREEGDKVLC